MNIASYHTLASDVVRKAQSLSLTKSDVEFWRDIPNPPDPQDAPYQRTGFERLDRVIEAVGVRFMYGGNDAANNVNRPDDKRPAVVDNHNHYIVMPNMAQFHDRSKYAGVLAHEMIHWATIRDETRPLTGMNPVDKLLSMFFGVPVAYTVDEIVAEVGSVLLLTWAGATVEPVVYERISVMIASLPDDRRETLTREATETAVREFLNLLKHAGVDPTE